VSLKKLGRYDLVRVLGKGAMGVVYEGRDPNLERRVAIKTVKVENLSEEAAAEYEARFRTEARSAARLQHPNIVSVYDSDRDGDIAFLVMEYIQGDDLKHHLDRGVRYSLEQSLKMIRDLLAALDYAHKAGIVHRDIKPANLLIEPGGRVKLTDFGVARIQDSGEATRTQGSMVGTLKYMAPEQVQGLKIDSRADLFSVGVVLYQLLTDKRPFDGDNDFSIIHQIIGHTPPPPSSFNARLPPAIDAVVARALAKDRENRFATARDFASALQSAIRRAEDATVVPPADPFKKPDAAGSSKGTVPSMVGTATSSGTSATTGTATVTQELELVYWKDIKDSTEPEEFEGFLQQFPAGIYADLARRRLRKLAGGGSSPEQTLLMPRVADGPAPGRAADLDATRVRSDPSIPMAAPLIAPASPPAFGSAAAWHASAAARVGSDDSDATLPPRAAVAAAPAAALAATAAPAVGPATAAPVEPEPEVPQAVVTPAATGRQKPPVAMLAGGAAVVVAALAAFLMMGRGGESKGAAGPPATPAASQPLAAAGPAAAPLPAPAPATPVVAEPAAVTRVAAVPETATAPAAASSTKARAASAPRRPASARRAPSAPMAAAAPSPSTAAAPELHEQGVALRPAPPPASVVPRQPPPADACKDKFFLSRQLCLQEECVKPGYRNLPSCVKFREETRIREESKIRN
jgi:serine/threonine protein kinase